MFQVGPASSGSSVDEGSNITAMTSAPAWGRGRIAEGQAQSRNGTVASLGRTKSEGPMCDVVM